MSIDLELGVAESTLDLDSYIRSPKRTQLCLEEVRNRAMEIARYMRECIHVVAINGSGRVVRDRIVAVGDSRQCACDAAMVYSHVLYCGAAGIFVMHNHPSGDLTVSDEDMHFAQVLVNAGELFRIPVLDFLIGIDDSDGCPKVLSLVEQGILPTEQWSALSKEVPCGKTD